MLQIFKGTHLGEQKLSQQRKAGFFFEVCIKLIKSQ